MSDETKEPNLKNLISTYGKSVGLDEEPADKKIQEFYDKFYKLYIEGDFGLGNTDERNAHTEFGKSIAANPALFDALDAMVKKKHGGEDIKERLLAANNTYWAADLVRGGVDLLPLGTNLQEESEEMMLEPYGFKKSGSDDDWNRDHIIPTPAQIDASQQASDESAKKEEEAKRAREAQRRARMSPTERQAEDAKISAEIEKEVTGFVDNLYGPEEEKSLDNPAGQPGAQSPAAPKEDGLLNPKDIERSGIMRNKRVHADKLDNRTKSGTRVIDNRAKANLNASADADQIQILKDLKRNAREAKTKEIQDASFESPQGQQVKDAFEKLGGEGNWDKLTPDQKSRHMRLYMNLPKDDPRRQGKSLDSPAGESGGFLPPGVESETDLLKSMEGGEGDSLEDLLKAGVQNDLITREEADAPTIRESIERVGSMDKNYGDRMEAIVDGAYEDSMGPHRKRQAAKAARDIEAEKEYNEVDFPEAVAGEENLIFGPADDRPLEEVIAPLASGQGQTPPGTPVPTAPPIPAPRNDFADAPPIPAQPAQPAQDKDPVETANVDTRIAEMETEAKRKDLDLLRQELEQARAGGDQDLVEYIQSQIKNSELDLWNRDMHRGDGGARLYNWRLDHSAEQQPAQDLGLGAGAAAGISGGLAPHESGNVIDAPTFNQPAPPPAAPPIPPPAAPPPVPPGMYDDFAGAPPVPPGMYDDFAGAPPVPPGMYDDPFLGMTPAPPLPEPKAYVSADTPMPKPAPRTKEEEEKFQEFVSMTDPGKVSAHIIRQGVPQGVYDGFNEPNPDNIRHDPLDYQKQTERGWWDRKNSRGAMVPDDPNTREALKKKVENSKLTEEQKRQRLADLNDVSLDRPMRSPYHAGDVAMTPEQSKSIAYRRGAAFRDPYASQYPSTVQQGSAGKHSIRGPGGHLTDKVPIFGKNGIVGYRTKGLMRDEVAKQGMYANPVTRGNMSEDERLRKKYSKHLV